MTTQTNKKLEYSVLISDRDAIKRAEARGDLYEANECSKTFCKELNPEAMARACMEIGVEANDKAMEYFKKCGVEEDKLKDTLITVERKEGGFLYTFVNSN